MRPATPARFALAMLSATSRGSISTPSPVAPRRAAATTMRPSPLPRSITWSPAPTAARSSIAAVTLSGVVMYGTSSPSAAGTGDEGVAEAATAKTSGRERKK